MPAGYVAATELESTFGDAFTAEISNLRVSESLPSDPGVPTGIITHYAPAGSLVLPTMRRSRRPSNIVPVGHIDAATQKSLDVFYLGLDLEFVGTQLGYPAMPDQVSVEVRFFLEGYGPEEAGAGGSAASRRYEISIAPQIFADLNANPNPPVMNGVVRPDRETRHSLWVQVAGSDPTIIAAPQGVAWTDLFRPETIYRVAASVKIVDVKLCPPIVPFGTGFIEGLVMQTEAWNPYIVP